MAESEHFCAICGVWQSEHPPDPPPGPPDPPPTRGLGESEADFNLRRSSWRPSHAFKPSEESFAELLDERDAQIKLWTRRALRAERCLAEIHRRSAPEAD